jgi:hypothetical protein
MKKKSFITLTPDASASRSGELHDRNYPDFNGKFDPNPENCFEEKVAGEKFRQHHQLRNKVEVPMS